MNTNLKKYRILLQTSIYRGYHYYPKTKVEFVYADSLFSASKKAIAQTTLKGCTPVEMSMGWAVWPQ